MKPKAVVGIIGAGDIGFNIAELLAFKGHDVILHNRYHGNPSDAPSKEWLNKMGKIMDLTDALQIPATGTVSLTHNIYDLKDAKFIIITAGAKRSSTDETREQLAYKNMKIMDGFVDFFVDYPDILKLIVTNPVDVLVNYCVRQVALKSRKEESEIAKKLVGVSYVDTMRLQNAVKEFLNEEHPNIINPVIEGVAIGEHGPKMVPIMSQVTVNAKPLEEFANLEQINNIRQQTVLRGNDIIKLTGASSVSGPAHAAVYMVEQIDMHPKVYIPCSVWDGKRSIGQMVEFLAYQANRIVPVTKTSVELEMMEECRKYLDQQYYNIINS